MTDLISVIQAIGATAAAAVGTFFLRFWRDTSDRLFLFFAVAFWLMSASYLALAVFDPNDEGRPYVSVVRLLAFALIIAAIIDKNRASKA
jgi:hypothetical protein